MQRAAEEQLRITPDARHAKGSRRKRLRVKGPHEKRYRGIVRRHCGARGAAKRQACPINDQCVSRPDGAAADGSSFCRVYPDHGPLPQHLTSLTDEGRQTRREVRGVNTICLPGSISWPRDRFRRGRDRCARHCGAHWWRASRPLHARWGAIAVMFRIYAG